MQLNLFDIVVEPKDVEMHPWLLFWPDWMPEVGRPATIHDVIIDGYGYTHMERVIVKAINGTDIETTTEWLGEYMQNHKNQGRKMNVKVWQLWPPVSDLNRASWEKGTVGT